MRGSIPAFRPHLGCSTYNMESASVSSFPLPLSDTDDTTAVFPHRPASCDVPRPLRAQSARPAHRLLLRFFTIHTEFCQMQILSVVCFFHTVNNRSSFYGNTAGVLAYKRIGCQKLDFHREVQADRLTLRPYFCHIQIPVFFFHFCAFWNLFS